MLVAFGFSPSLALAEQVPYCSYEVAGESIEGVCDDSFWKYGLKDPVPNWVYKYKRVCEIWREGEWSAEGWGVYDCEGAVANPFPDEETQLAKAKAYIESLHSNCTVSNVETSGWLSEGESFSSGPWSTISPDYQEGVEVYNGKKLVFNLQCEDGNEKSDWLSATRRRAFVGFINTAPITPLDGADGEKALGAPEWCAGNPINIGTANKFQSETDYPSQAAGGISLTRYFNSQDDSEGALSVAWRHNYERSLNPDADTVGAVRADGKLYTFTQDGPNWESDPDVADSLAATSTGWRYTTAEGVTETYDADGRLLSITDAAGRTQSLSYDADGKLAEITDAYGRALQFTYDRDGRVVALTDPAGAVTTYHYRDGRLSGVTYPDGSERNYLYENPDYPNALTGVVDASGNQIAAWSYDENGWAVSSAHAGGADATEVAYHDDDSVTVTNALGKQTTYHFEVYHGMPKVVEVEGHATEHCAGANRSYEYNEDGFVIAKTDWRGNTTTYVRDEDGREVSRTEAVGTPEERTVTTEWHSELDKPVRIMGPKQVTVFRYDEKGRLLERATSPR